ncbi:MAG: sugar transferase [Lachnospiraceae bacterium]|nr:sugar transferase [Lachnospiraceae bacterium]
MLKKWETLPDTMQTPEVAQYYEILQHKPLGLFCKRLFDILVSLILLVLLSPVMLIISIWIKCDSKGPVMFRQTRVTTAGKEFRIFKFRTMVTDAEKLGTQVTVGKDPRITRSGHFLRKFRLDELPQLLNVLAGDMSFVGTRPEVPRYVEKYTPEMWATLLLPAGITSEASIKYKDEDKLLEAAEDVDQVYVEQVLPGKMKYNLDYIRSFHFLGDIRIMIQTVFAVLR